MAPATIVHQNVRHHLLSGSWTRRPGRELSGLKGHHSSDAAQSAKLAKPSKERDPRRKQCCETRSPPERPQWFDSRFGTYIRPMFALLHHGLSYAVVRSCRSSPSAYLLRVSDVARPQLAAVSWDHSQFPFGTPSTALPLWLRVAYLCRCSSSSSVIALLHGGSAA